MDKLFLEVIDYFRAKIPDTELDSDVDVYRHSSPTIALECLCSQIDDHQIPVDAHIFDCLKSLCEAKGVDFSYLEGIKRYLV